MKKIVQKIIAIAMVFAMGTGMVAPAIQAAPAYATSETTTFGAQAAILKDCAKKGSANGEGVENGGKGEGIVCVIELVVDIFSILIGVVGVIGIVWVGIQYLTAGGNEEKTRKAKRRLFEIIIGVAVYAAGYALLKWLLPNFS